MKDHLAERPHKTVFPREKIDALRNQAIAKIQDKLLPNVGILKIIIIGSSVTNAFGKYEPPGFRGSLYSDFDFIIFVADEYEIPDRLEKEQGGKPFPDDSMNLAFRSRKFVEDMYDVEVFFIRKSNSGDTSIQEQGELAGIPMTEDSTHQHLVVYIKD